MTQGGARRFALPWAGLSPGLWPSAESASRSGMRVCQRCGAQAGGGTAGGRSRETQGQRPATSQPWASEERVPPWVSHDMNVQALERRATTSTGVPGCRPFRALTNHLTFSQGVALGWLVGGPLALLPRTAGHEQRAGSPVRQLPLFPSASSALAGAGARDANIVTVSRFRLDSALASVEAI